MSKVWYHLLFVGRWNEFVIKIPRGKVEVYHDSSSPIFEWNHENPLKSFLPIYYYFSTEKRYMGLQYDCITSM